MQGIRVVGLVIVIAVIALALGATTGHSVSSGRTVTTTSHLLGTVTATEETAFVGIYYAEPCVNGSTTTTYAIVSSSQTYSNITVYPLSFPTQDVSEYSVTIVSTVTTVATFIPITTTISMSTLSACPVVHPMP